MKNKFESLKAYYKLHPKRFWVLGGVVILILIALLTRQSASTVTAIAVEKADLKQTVLATGQVTSQIDLNLSFSAGGLVSSLPVAVGTKVYRGQTLAMLDNRTEYAALAQAQAGLKSAQANYQKVSEGASNEEVAVAQAAFKSAETDLANTKKLQDTLVANAHRALLSADLTPVLTSGSSGTAPTVTGTYTGEKEGSYVISVYTAGSGQYFNYSGLEIGTAPLSSSAPTALGTKGLFIQFPESTLSSDRTWTVLLPNTKSATYLTQYNAYQTALGNRDSIVAASAAALAQRQADLDLKKAAARPADLAVAEAQVLTAEAQVASAQATYSNKVLTAPANGTIVHVDTKIGERVEAQKKVVVLQDVSNLYVEANINETNIAKVMIGQPVVMTLDAFGPDVSFTGSVVHIDPSATTTDGVANYVIKVSITDPSGKNAIRPGMNANMTITAWTHPASLVIPKAAVTTTADGVSTVNVITDEKKEKYTSRPITIGLVGDGNLVEVLTGLTEGEKVALIAK
jgi:RND family efflux transporter MFP subunit